MLVAVNIAKQIPVECVDVANHLSICLLPQDSVIMILLAFIARNTEVIQHLSVFVDETADIAVLFWDAFSTGPELRSFCKEVIFVLFLYQSTFKMSGFR